MATTLSDWLGEAPRTSGRNLRGFRRRRTWALGRAPQRSRASRLQARERAGRARRTRARYRFGLARERRSLAHRAVTADDQASTELYAPTRGLVGTPRLHGPRAVRRRAGQRSQRPVCVAVALFVAVFGQHPFQGRRRHWPERAHHARARRHADAPQPERCEQRAAVRQCFSTGPVADAWGTLQ